MNVAIYATRCPHPSGAYAGFPIGGGTVFIRLQDVSESSDPLGDGEDAALDGEFFVNTVEFDDAALAPTENKDGM